VEISPETGAALNMRLDSLRTASHSGNVDELRNSIERFALTLCQEYGDVDIGEAFYAASRKVMAGMPVSVREGILRSSSGKQP
jgi:DNA-binding NtrC family response regulator